MEDVLSCFLTEVLNTSVSVVISVSIVMNVLFTILLIDVNECAGPLNQCAFRCFNTRGSFRCICPMGYQVAADGIHCEGMS